MRKTFKREVGWAMLGGLAAVAAFAILWQSAEALEVLKITWGPATAYNGAAQGADWVAKQTNWGGSPSEMEGS